jgi:hypothetical protein
MSGDESETTVTAAVGQSVTVFFEFRDAVMERNFVLGSKFDESLNRGVAQFSGTAHRNLILSKKFQSEQLGRFLRQITGVELAGDVQESHRRETAGAAVTRHAPDGEATRSLRLKALCEPARYSSLSFGIVSFIGWTRS